MRPNQLPSPDQALPGRDQPIVVSPVHLVLNTPMMGPFAPPLDVAIFAMGCFWGVERKYWQEPGVYCTAAGYSGGYTKNPTYREVCSGQTGHTEVVQVVFDPAKVSYERLLQLFWESHDPTQGMRQGNDQGTQYRSAIYYLGQAQKEKAHASMQVAAKALQDRGLGPITSEIAAAGPFYYAEDEHQQYLHKHPGGYCALKGTGISCSL